MLLANKLVLDSSTPIYLAGHGGMLGRAVLKRLREGGFKNIVHNSNISLT